MDPTLPYIFLEKNYVDEKKRMNYHEITRISEGLRATFVQIWLN